jgi:hypothetical protein
MRVYKQLTAQQISLANRPRPLCNCPPLLRCSSGRLGLFSAPKVAKPVRKKRVLSAVGKAAIVAALKKRWAAKKAAAKK